MPFNPLLAEEDEDYASSQDSDFAPDDVSKANSDGPDSADEGAEPTKQNAKEEEIGDYNNSGDEAILERGRKRQKRAKNKGDASDEEAGEGGLIKTRRQRAAEKQNRAHAKITGPITVDIDAIWAEMMAGKFATPQTHATAAAEETAKRNEKMGSIQQDDAGSEPATADDNDTGMIHLRRKFRFAGRVQTQEKLVHRDSAEAKLHLASQTEETSIPKKAPRKRFRSAFEPVMDDAPKRTDLDLRLTTRMKAAKEAQAKKLNTLEKSRMDWAGYVDKEGIRDELELAGKSKDSYAAQQDFLARSEAKRNEMERKDEPV